jgi:hypothetical protein
VRDRIKLSRSSSLSFGLARFSNSEFELVANEISMDHSAVKVFGALRMTVRVLVMTRSAIEVLASKDDLIVATSTVEASSMVLLQGGSSVQSNSNLGIYGQGLLSLIGLGDCIKAQRLFLSLFYQIYVSIIFVNLFSLFSWCIHCMQRGGEVTKEGNKCSAGRA